MEVKYEVFVFIVIVLPSLHNLVENGPTCGSNRLAQARRTALVRQPDL